MSRWLVFVAACEATSPPAPVASHIAPPPVHTCITDVLADGDMRSQMGGKVVYPAEPKVDIDGDGAEDPFYEGPEIGGNRDIYLYASDHGCMRYVGTVHASFLSTPHCVEPAKPGSICKISVMRYMIHGDEYEYFYTCGGGTCSEAGTGRHVPVPPGGP